MHPDETVIIVSVCIVDLPAQEGFSPSSSIRGGAMEMHELEALAEKSSAMPVMKYAMWACCAVMLLPIAAFVMAGGLAGGLSSGLYIFAPVLLCIGAHVIMHRTMGKSRHGAVSEEARQTGDAAIEVDQKFLAE